MSDPESVVPHVPALGQAAEHRSGAERAAERHDYDVAVRERFRAVVRGLEQAGVLDEQRARTARRTAYAAGERLPDDAPGLNAAVEVFDEVVYGGRAASEVEYRRLADVDRFSLAPPSKAGPTDVTEVAGDAKRARAGRTRLTPPDLLRNPKTWLVIAIVLVVLAAVAIVLQDSSSPAPTPSAPTGESPRLPDIHIPSRRGLLAQLPAPLLFGGMQLLLAGVILALWRGRRRGALVPEPRPVDVPAGELTVGRAQLYRRSGDREFVAGKLRAAALRRVRRVTGLPSDATWQDTIAVIAARTGRPDVVAAALYGPVVDDASLAVVAAQLEWIEAEVGTS